MKIITQIILVLLIASNCNTDKDSSHESVLSDKTIEYIDVEGGTLPYYIEGDGIPCIVLCTYIMDPKTYSDKLRKHLKFIFLNCRHFDIKNNLKPEEVSANTYLNDIESLRKKLNYDRIAILGHSIHGIIAVKYAEKYPEHTSHVILIGSPPYFNRSFNSEKEKYWTDNASEERKIRFNENWRKGKRKISNWFLPEDKKFIKEIIARAPQRWYDLEFNPEKLWEGVEININLLYQLFGRMVIDFNIQSEFKIPTFVAIGKYDYAIPYTTWTENQKNKMQNISFNIFDKSSHFPQMEQQELFDNKLIEWIEN